MPSGQYAAESTSGSWLEALVNTQDFFKPCPRCSHRASGREITVNHFDVDAAEPSGVCSICMGAPLAAGHRLLQVRRSSYHDVVKVSDIAKLANIGAVQTYVINSSKVIFIKRRPQPRPPGKSAPGVSQCVICHRHLQDVNDYCSLQCKLDGEEGFAGSFAPISPTTSSGSQTPPSTPPRHEVHRYYWPTHLSDNEQTQVQSHFTSRRKGHPHRSPFE